MIWYLTDVNICCIISNVETQIYSEQGVQHEENYLFDHDGSNAVLLGIRNQIECNSRTRPRAEL